MEIGALIIIKVPYPGKYVVAKLDIVGGKTDKRTMFFVPLINFGEEDIKSAKAEELKEGLKKTQKIYCPNGYHIFFKINDIERVYIKKEDLTKENFFNEEKHRKLIKKYTKKHNLKTYTTHQKGEKNGY